MSEMELSVDIKELEKVLAPVVSAQLLSAYYTLLTYARQHGDSRTDDELFRDCMGDFLIVSQMFEGAIRSLESLDPESLLLKLKGHLIKG
jgi:hypothetical protein